MNDKKEIRKLQNRESAKKSRQRKIDFIHLLQDTAHQYESLICGLKLENMGIMNSSNFKYSEYLGCFSSVRASKEPAKFYF